MEEAPDKMQEDLTFTDLTPEGAPAQEAVPAKPRLRLFRLFLLFYVLICVGVTAFFLSRLYRLLVSYEAAYERSLPDAYAAAAFTRVASGNTDDLELLLADGTAPDNKPFNNRSVVDQYLASKNRAGFYDADYSHTPGEPVKRAAGEAVYEFPAEGSPFFRLTLSEIPDALPYGFSAWEATAVQLLDETFLPVSITFHLPSDASVSIDDVTFDDSFVTEDHERITLLDTVIAEHLVNEEDIPTMKTLTIPDIFLSDNEIVIRGGDGDVIPFEPDENGVYEAAQFYAPDDFIEETGAFVEGMIEPWGLFFSRDGGYYNIQRYFWPGSPVDRYLPKVDVSWMQYHNRVSFEDKRAENYRLYNDRCFSCDVHFEQIIGVGDNPEVRRWDSDMTWIFIRPKDSDTWFLADMMTRTGE